MLSLKDFEPTLLPLRCCLCHQIPKYRSRHHTFGHGEFGVLGWVECSCGIRTKDFLVSGLYGCTETPNDAVALWNTLLGVFP